MHMVNVAINGFGRIGRLVLRAGINDPGLNFVAINDLGDKKVAQHLFKHDSIHGTFEGDVSLDGDFLVVNGKRIKFAAERDPAKLPWKELAVDIVVESTGVFTDKEGASKHLAAGAKKVLISAPGKNVDATIVMGVNDDVYDKAKHNVISNASCTTNCLAPMVKVLHENFGVKQGLMTTVHAVTNDQVVIDVAHKDLRRARSCMMSIIPTTTGAAKAVGEVVPALKGKLDGYAMRVPVTDGSATDFCCELEKEATVEQINEAFKKAAEGKLKNFLEYSADDLVSTDIIGNKHSCIFDSKLTKSYGKFIKVMGWYDNEWGYSCRMIDVLKKML
ncbi:type I glyceraldehyde-3-phosphate dehydrogenase [Candidatus Woesearchaeota archaeon]|nr:type I glyceraldehyde-3-phosphate dehydrogenase [Candidatus Woesearchaeota archaeon]